MDEYDVVVALLLACLNLLPGPTDATLALVVFTFSMSLGSIFVTESMVSSLWPYPPGWTLGKVVAIGYVAAGLIAGAFCFKKRSQIPSSHTPTTPGPLDSTPEPAEQTPPIHTSPTVPIGSLITNSELVVQTPPSNAPPTTSAGSIASATAFIEQEETRTAETTSSRALEDKAFESSTSRSVSSPLPPPQEQPKENDGSEKSTLPVTVSSTRQFDNNNEVEKSTSSSNKPPSEQSTGNDGDEKSTFPVTASSTRQFDNNNGVEKSTSSSNKPSPEQSDENDEVERSTLPETTPLPLPPPNSPLSPTTLALIPAASGMSSVAEEPTNYGVVNDAEFDRACTILSSGITDFALGAPAVEENVAAVWSVVQSILKVLQSTALNANDPWADFMLGLVLRAIETVHGRWQATLEPGYSHQWRMSLTQATTSVEDLTALTVRLESMPELNAWLAPLYHAARNLRLDLEKALGHDSAPYPHVPPETTGESMAWEPTNAAMALEPTNAVVAWESADDEMA
ncbi:hypothetical protein LTR28_001866, partial [Elasticomyces elasticus]